jgi:peptide/nickel transport system permease protein
MTADDRVPQVPPDLSPDAGPGGAPTTIGVLAAGQPLRSSPPAGGRLRAILANRFATTGAVILIATQVAAVLAPLLAPSSPSAVDLGRRLLPPIGFGGTGEHPLGTDALGRDVLSRIIYGTRNSLLIGFSVVLIAGVAGTVLGLLAGYVGGTTDAVIMRLADAQFAFPGLLLVIIVIGVLGPSIPTIVVVVSIYGWMIYARLVRGIVLQLREELYVRAAEISGVGTGRMMRKHLLPNLVSPLITQAMLEVARVMLVEASLSYLGLGIQPPGVSLGLMVSENQVYLRDAQWTVLFPGLTLAILILGINLLTNRIRGGSAGRGRSARKIDWGDASMEANR